MLKMNQYNGISLFLLNRKSEAKLKALYRCIEVPYSVALKANTLWPHLRQLAPIFNFETKSDLQVAVKCLETGIFGAYANVAINIKSFDPNETKVFYRGLSLF